MLSLINSLGTVSYLHDSNFTIYYDLDLNLPQTGNTSFNPEVLETLPEGNYIVLTIPAGFPVDFMIPSNLYP